MSHSIDKLPDLIAEATVLAIEEHLETLRMENSPESDRLSSEGKPLPNPNYLKIKAMKNKAASDLMRIMATVEPDALKGRRRDRLEEVLKRVKAWQSPAPATKQ